MTVAGEMALDARCLRSGMGTYAMNLLRELKSIAPQIRLQVLGSPEDADRLKPLCDQLTPVTARPHSVREQIEVPRAVASGKLLHSCHYNAPIFRRGPLLVTIADVIPLLDARYHASAKSRVLGRPMLRRIARRADHILTVSEYSRRQIVQELGVRSEKVSVSYCGVTAEFHPIDPLAARETCRKRLNVARPFLLYVGNNRPHKNVAGLLNAFAILRSKQDCDLLIIGCHEQRSELFATAAALRIAESLHVAPAVNEELLVAAYNAAEVLVLASFEEGFGLPVLEAMACGTPVACSFAASLPEVAGEAAAYFDPRDTGAIAHTAAAILDDSERRQQMRAAGLHRAAGFTWTKSAHEHVDVYQRYLQ